MSVHRLTCEVVARGGLGEPVKCEGVELLYFCPYPERHKNGDAHPSLKINPHKNAWGCFVCGTAGRSGWSLAAFLAGAKGEASRREARSDPSNKPAVTAWLMDKGLLPKRELKSKGKSGRGPVVAEFIHQDASGKPVCKKRRHEPGADGKDKDYTWQRFESDKWVDGLGGSTPPLYRLPQIKDEPLVFLFESHTDVDRAVSMGLVATTSGGAQSWRPDYAEALAGKNVCLIPDNNSAGAGYQARVCASLYGRVCSLKVVSIAPYLDFRRWADADGTVEQLLRMQADAPEFQPASGAELIRRFEDIFRDKIIAPKGVSLVGGLYALITHCYKIFSWIAYLAFLSPLESCGKSHAADIVGWASARPEILVSITQASLFRLITIEEPAVVIDEAEVLHGDGETAVALRAVLHAGNAADDAIIRYSLKTRELERFSPWCPKIFRAIGRLPRVLASRCIAVGMKRKKPGERTGKFIRDKVKNELAKLSAEMAVWVADHQKEIHRVYISLPDDSFEGRDRENFAPLEAVLTVANPARLPELAAVRVLLTGTSEANSTDDSPGARVLRDVRRVLVEKQALEMASAELCAALAQMESSPWAEYKGKPITAARLAALLKPFGIVPDRIGCKGSQARGYTLHQLEDAFSRYLPFPPAPQTVNPSTERINTGENEDLRPSSQEVVDTVKNADSSAENADGRRADTLRHGMASGSVTDHEARNEGERGEAAPEPVFEEGQI